MMSAMAVSSAIDVRLVRLLARMAMLVLDTVSAVSGSTTCHRSKVQVPVSSIQLSR